MGSLLCGAPAQALEECGTARTRERDARATERTACDQRAAGFAAHAGALASFDLLSRLLNDRNGPMLLYGHVVQPADLERGWSDCSGGLGGRCLTARALRPDATALTADPLDLSRAGPELAAMLVLDLATVPRVPIGVLGPKGAMRFLAPAGGGGGVTVRDAPFDWYVGVDAARTDPRAMPPVWWIHAFTDGDPAQASMLSLDVAAGALRLVPLASPPAALPLAIGAAAPKRV